MPKIRNKYSQKRNRVATVLISTFMCLWAIYIFPQSICLFCCRKYVDRSWEYINSSQTHESGNLDWGHTVSRKVIHKGDFWFSLQCTLPLWSFCIFPHSLHSPSIFLLPVKNLFDILFFFFAFYHSNYFPFSVTLQLKFKILSYFFLFCNSSFSTFCLCLERALSGNWGGDRPRHWTGEPIFSSSLVKSANSKYL
jgi:hypothetical protein